MMIYMEYYNTYIGLKERIDSMVSQKKPATAGSLTPTRHYEAVGGRVYGDKECM